jgi:hypothetical protein
MVFIQSAAAASLRPAALRPFPFFIHMESFVISLYAPRERSGAPVPSRGHVSCCRYRIEILIFSLRG